MTFNLQPHSHLLIATPGSGKSHFAATAIEALGGGVVFMAPGDDERNSYVRYNPETTVFYGFDDPDFNPVLGQWETQGYGRLMKQAKIVRDALTEDRAAGKPPRWPVVVTDTLSAMLDNLAWNETLKKFATTTAPPAISPDGNSFYSYLKGVQESIVRQFRAIKALGVHWIATAHQKEKEQRADLLVANATTAGIEGKVKFLSPLIPGSMSDKLAGAFDLVSYVKIGKDKDGKTVHYLQLDSDPRRMSKAREGLKVTGNVANNWPALVSRIQKERETNG